MKKINIFDPFTLQPMIFIKFEFKDFILKAKMNNSTNSDLIDNNYEKKKKKKKSFTEKKNAAQGFAR